MANQDDKYHRQAQLDLWEHLLGYDVVDIDGGKIGTVKALWEDYTRQPAYLGVATSWLDMGRIHVVPAQFATLSEKRRCLRLPFTADVVKDAPQCHATDEITLKGETRIRDYYRKQGGVADTDSAAREAMSRHVREDAPSRSPDWRASRDEDDEDEPRENRSFRDRIRDAVDDRKSRIEREREERREEIRDDSSLGRPEREMGLPFEEPDERPLRKVYRDTPVAEPVLPREEDSAPRHHRDDPDDFVPLRKENLKSERRRRDVDRDDLPLR